MAREAHVIGASTAGLYAAYRLARKGFEVHLYDAEPNLNPAPRTLILTPYFQRALDFPSDEVIINRVWRFELISASASATVTLKEPDLVVERRKLFELLLRQASEAGVDIHWGHRLEGLEEEGGSLLLRFRTDQGYKVVLSSSVIGADGAKSTVGRLLGRRALPLVAVVQAKVNFPKPIPADKVQVWFDRNRTRFFVWLIPESPTTGVVGLVADGMEEAHRSLEDFLSSHSWEPSSFQSAIVPLYLPGTGMVAGKGLRSAILVGDAAGHMKNTTVGGVVSGLRGASALTISSGGVKVGSAWQALKRELWLHAWLRRLLDTFSDEDYNLLLKLLNARSLRILAAYPRDDFAKAIIPLLLSQPRWFLLGARSFLKAMASQL
jgi:flavin-dependent dehydrogenase